MKVNKCILGAFLLITTAGMGQPIRQLSFKGTWSNPLALNYQFSDNGLGYREAADPVISYFKGDYYLYASKSGGYWYSKDLHDWVYRPSKILPVKDYAPAVMTIGDTVFFMASGGERNIYYNLTPKQDVWKIYRKALPLSVTDPDLFLDDDGRVYFYYGCSNVDPIMGVELSRHNAFEPIGEPKVLISHNFQEHGFERPGEQHEQEKKGWNEGAWMTKHNGLYYLQYAAPGTEFKTYADGVYVSENPLGPFSYLPNSPFSYKPGGFISGAGHGSTFKDKYGNYWHVATMSISIRHMFERRIGLFPAYFDKGGNLYCNTAFGDYPLKRVGRKMDFSKESLFTNWMLLSYNKPVTASSSLKGHEPQLAVNEDVRTWWSAKTGNKGEWLLVDLEDTSSVKAFQLNFADQDAGLKDLDYVAPYKYIIEASLDGKNWRRIVDRSANTLDRVHDYIELDTTVVARFIKIENVAVPAGKFSLSGFRVFGKGRGPLPDTVSALLVNRDPKDERSATIEWKKARGADGYVLYYGESSGRLEHSIMIYDQTDFKLNSLNANVPYYFRVDSFNEAGISAGKPSSAY